MLIDLFFRPHRSLAALTLLVLLLFVSGCGGGSSGPDLGDWTLTTGDLTLDKDLQVSETERYFFGSIQDLAVTREGRMVVLDADANHLKILRPDGTLLDTLGREGQGPGEFQRPTNIALARGDSVYVFDNQINRLSVFLPPPSSELARSVSITSDVGSATEVQVLGERLVGRFTPGFTREEGLRRPSPATWRRLHETGMPGDTLLISKRQRVATSFGGPGIVIARLPFGRVTRTAPGPDARLYHGVTDSLQISTTSLDGATENIANVPTNPVPIPEAERDSTLGEIPERIRGDIETAFPNTKPAFTDLIVADDGQLWVERPAKTAEAATTTWWVLDPESKIIQAVQLPSEVDVKVVQDGKVYATTTTENGAPALVRYQLQPRR